MSFDSSIPTVTRHAALYSMSLHKASHDCVSQMPMRGWHPSKMMPSNKRGRLSGNAFRQISLSPVGCTFDRMPLARLGMWLDQQVRAVDRLQEWIIFRETEEALHKAKVLPVLHEVLSGEVAIEEAGESYLARFYRVWLDAAYSGDVALHKFRPDQHEHLIEMFRGVTLRSTHVFPLGVAAVQVTSGTNVAAIRSLSRTDNVVAVVRGEAAAGAAPASFVGKIGVAAGVLDRMNLADEAVQVTFQGKRRVRIASVATDGPWPVAEVVPVPPLEESRPELDRRIGAVLRLAETLASLDPAVNVESVDNLRTNVEDASHFADLVAQQLPFSLVQRDRIVAAPAAAARLDMLADFLAAAVERAEVQREVDRLTTLHVERGRREYLLRQQLEAIRAELGEDDALREARELKGRLEGLKMPDTARAEALRELDRLGRLTPASAEYQVSRTYVDWMLALPWGIEVEERRPNPAACGRSSISGTWRSGRRRPGSSNTSPCAAWRRRPGRRSSVSWGRPAWGRRRLGAPSPTRWAARSAG